jgi:DNA-binding LacI/PurR family transcriptional regulator
MAVTMADVARRTGVSKQTVSAVINGKPGITAATADRVRRVIAELDYHPNVLAGSLRNRRSAIIGLIVGSITDPFWAEVAQGVEAVAQRRGYVVLLCNLDGDRAKEATYLRALRRHQAAGVIQGILDGVPYTLLDVPAPVDRRGGYVATAHLLDLGHRRIGCVVYDAPDAGPGYERSMGYRAALADWGRPVDEALVVCGTYSYAGGRRAAEQLLALRPAPTAIFVQNELMAIGLLSALDQQGLRVPEQVAVIAYSGTPLSACYTPPVSTVGMPIFQLGVQAMTALADRIEGRESPAEPHPLDYELVVRRSTVPGLVGEHRCGLFATDTPWSAWKSTQEPATPHGAGAAPQGSGAVLPVMSPSSAVGDP